MLDCGTELLDISSFEATLYPEKVEIGDVINNPPTLTKKPDCKPLQYDPAGCTGPVDVKSSLLIKEKYKIKDDSPPTITIEFAEHSVKIMNSKGKVRQEIEHFPGSELDTNVGNKINFKGNRKPQNIKVPGGN